MMLIMRTTELCTALRVSMKLSHSSWPALDDFLSAFIFYNHVRRKNASPRTVRINNRATSDDGAGIENGIASDVGPITKQRSELPQARIKGLAIDFHHHVSRHQFD